MTVDGTGPSAPDAIAQRLTAASILSIDPPIVYVRPRPAPFGVVGMLAANYAARPMVCIARTMWTLESESELAGFSVVYFRFREKYPHVRLIAAANTDRELELLNGRGIEAVLANHNIFVDERVFRLLPDIARIHDAVYNASFSAFKRRELCAELATCVHLGYPADPDQKNDFLAALRAEQAKLPHHHFVNPVKEGVARRLAPREVNEVLATAHVGLCLSQAEGAMVASIEYLLAGLPVVTTPNRGGRDRYLTPETSILAAPNPRAVREAVEALKARAIPRRVVRDKTQALVNRDRLKFNDFIEALRDGRPPLTSDPRWRCRYVNNLYRWGRAGEFAAELGLTPLAPEAVSEALWYEDDPPA